MKLLNSNEAGSATVLVAPAGVSPVGSVTPSPLNGAGAPASSPALGERTSKAGEDAGAPIHGEGGWRGSRRGVALVLTLIMLAIITVVTVVFLATARRNRQSTSLRREQSGAEFATADAYQRASAEVITRILHDTNLLSFDFFVSAPLTNVLGTNYPDYAVGWFDGVLNPSNRNQIPVVTNASNTLGVFLDWNRDHLFNDPYDYTNAPFGDPIWIGIPEKQWLPIGPNNRFIGRMAYVVLPVGKSLDLNTIHNAASSTTGYDFKRNQGFGPWEMNLAAFLADLQPDVWWSTPNGNLSQYGYGPFPSPIAGSASLSSGNTAFKDARSIIGYRYDWGRTIPRPRLADTFPNAIAPPYFPPPSIDAYGDGAGPAGNVLGVNPFAPDDDVATKAVNFGWPGADAVNHWFHPQELFQVTNVYSPGKVTTEFATNLYRAINGWTPDGVRADPLSFYRLIAQLGTDTGSDYHERINLNYAALGTNSADQFISWTNYPVEFFTNVAQRIFLAQSNEFNALSTNTIPIRSITEIPVYPTNLYSTAIHRILQEAANVYDAINTNLYPSVFRPLFGPGPMTGVNYIVGFTNDDRVSTLQAWIDTNTNGIPLVVGTKKGFPNFNELTYRSEILVSRKLQVTRTAGNPPAPGRFPDATNQMYVLGISNYYGVEAWNSYDYQKNGSYPRPVLITVTNQSTCWLSNDLGFQTNATFISGATTNISSGWLGGITRGFIVPIQTNQTFLSNAVYRFGNNRFENISTNAFETGISDFPLPYWVYTASNRLTYLMSEGNRIVDFVFLNDNQQVDLFRSLIAAADPYAGVAGSAAVAGVWKTNRPAGPTGPPEGIIQQMQIAMGILPTSLADWNNFALAALNSGKDKDKAIDAFRVFLGFGQLTTNVLNTNSVFEMQAGFNPAAKLEALSTWQANDPIVHYHPADLRLAATNNYQYLKPNQPATNIPPSSLGRLNERYAPWGGNPLTSASTPSEFDRRIKDAGIYSSDDWAFPRGPLASVGLLGRIHRGTPWQTVYFKSEPGRLFPDNGVGSTDPTAGWIAQSADLATRVNGTLFSRTHPTNDWKLADMFTTSIDERTSRGFMSVNQTNLASWSALLSGVVVLSNDIANGKVYGQSNTFLTPHFISPVGDTNTYGAGNVPPLLTVYKAIQEFRATNFPNGIMENVGDLLQVPELTVNSPYLTSTNNNDNRQWRFSDAAYEQIPQQILSLLRLGQPRFVIYAYGQALKPASIDPATGLVRNYQVTAEHATRTVMRIEGDPQSKLRAVVESFNVLPPD